MESKNWIEMSEGCVVGPNAQAITAGKEILAEGGNAVDAAVAAGFASCVVNQSGNGIAGYGGGITIHLAESGQTHTIDFDTDAPAAANENLYDLIGDPESRFPYTVRDDANMRGYLSMSVPGTVAGLALAAESFGTMSLSDLLQPSIRLCRDGFIMPEGLDTALKNNCERFSKFPGTMALLYRDGEPIPPGERVTNPDLGDALDMIAAAGPEAFYEGDLTRHIVDDVRRNGGLLTLEDFAAYEPRTPEPIEVEIGPFTLRTVPPPAGGISVLQALMVSEAFQGMLDLPPDSPMEIRSRVEIGRLVWYDRLDHIGDPKFVDVPVDHLLDRTHAAELAYRVTHVLKEGPRPEEPALPDPGGTIHISAADRDGNLAALTQTHGVGFGSGVVVPGTGFVMSGGMFLFDPGPGSANSIAPRKRPLHNMCPTIVLKDGRPFATIGATGGRKIPATLHQILMHMLLRGKDIDDAFASSRVHFESRGPVFTFSVDEPAQDYLRKLGFDVRQGSANPHGIQLDLESSRIMRVSTNPML